MNSNLPLSQICILFTKKCTDLKTKKEVIIKRIKEDKRYLDQSLIEVYVLSLLAKRGDPMDHSFLQVVDYFYLNVN